VITSILSISIFGYLSLIEQQSRLGARSQAWNTAMALVEAGVEEGLQHLNSNFGNLGSQGWTTSGNIYSISNVLGTAAYKTVIDCTDPLKPEITCQAYVSAAAFASFAALGVNTSETISRKVRVRCSRGSLFLRALAAKNEINMNGNNILTDSFDSSNPLYSNLGKYDPNKVKDKGDVASNDSIKNAINVGNANIYGHVATGPGGTVAIGSNGGVGSHEWQAANGSGFQPGWITHDSNFTFPDTSIPYASGLTPTSGWIAEQIFDITSSQVVTNQAPSYSPWGGVSNWVSSWAEVTMLPDPLPVGLKTNSNLVITTNPPNPAPPGMETFVKSYTGLLTYPTGAPGPVTTSLVTTNNSPILYPPPAGTVSTNYVVQWVEEKTYPAAGTYVGLVTEVNGNKYRFQRILSRSYSYSYNMYSYDEVTYKYYVTSYSMPVYNYSYNSYTTNSYWQTNYYDNVLASGKYYLAGALSGKTYVSGQAELVCAGGISMSGNDVLKIAQGASLTNWVGGTSVDIGGNGVMNTSGNAANFICLCSTSVKSLSIGGNGEFCGVMVAPEAVTQLNGGGSSSMDFIGCLMIKSIKLNGHYKFHYDESLGNMGGNGRFLINSWDEIAASL
jgi:hypothetical protein